MLYGIAEVLATELGAEVVVVNVGGEAHAPDRFSYPLALPSIDLEGYRAAARGDDLLVMSPAFSHLWLGRTAPRRKLMYLQHFNTFRMLDTLFTDYVCVSRHTSDMLRVTYGIRAEVIPACIEPVAESPPAWSARPERRVLVNLKGDRALNGQLLEEIRSGLAARGLEPEFVDPVQGGVQHAELMRTLGSHRFLLTLTDSEGFGLLPLEAMARGVAVTGFDGFGGREYMRHGRNSLCHPFPRVDRVIDSLALLMTDERRARTIAAAGQKTAQSYSAQRFRAAWRGLLTRLVSARSATQQN
ncbi:MAG: glycosyltransferase family 4 protein [Devosia sp.]|nr:glycosyltransferase family 4 protein [Devosia sp.]